VKAYTKLLELLACKYAPADASLLFERAIVCSNSKRPAEAERRPPS